MKDGIHCLLMLGPAGDSRPELWLSRARLAAALDLAERLRELPQVATIEALAAEPDQVSTMAAVADNVRVSSEDFHFGVELATWAEQHAGSPLAYFGGASAPLLDRTTLAPLMDSAMVSDQDSVWVNNLHSSDWCVFWPSVEALRCIRSQTNDNGLGWSLSSITGHQVKALPVSAVSRVDIDTPIDPYMMENHPTVGPHLKRFVAEQGDPRLRARVGTMKGLLESEGGSLAIIGRSSSSVWSEIERRTHVWVRMMVEERGMVASGRLERGEVRSMVADWITSVGPSAMVRSLSRMVDGAVWDTRVWMGTSGRWPSAKDRFAADLGWLEDIQSESLRDLTAAIFEAEIPILTGGHGLVSGGLLALLEGLDRSLG